MSWATVGPTSIPSIPNASRSIFMANPRSLAWVIYSARPLQSAQRREVGHADSSRHHAHQAQHNHANRTNDSEPNHHTSEPMRRVIQVAKLQREAKRINEQAWNGVGRNHHGDSWNHRTSSKGGAV